MKYLRCTAVGLPIKITLSGTSPKQQQGCLSMLPTPIKYTEVLHSAFKLYALYSSV